MKNRFSIKRTAIVLSAAALLTAGVPGLTGVTAFATGVTNTDGINVRDAADGEMIDQLEDGVDVTILSSAPGSDGQTWYEIRYSSDGSERTGWVRSDLLDADVSSLEEAAAEEEEEAAAEEAAAEEEQAAADAAAAEEAEKAAEEAQEPVVTSAEGINLVIASSIPVEMIPDGFHETTVTYEDTEVPALEMDTAEVYLLYMEDTSNQTPGMFVVYDIDQAELIPYINFATNDGFILLLNIPEAELSAVSDRFELTTYEFDSGTMDALQMTQADAIIAESANLSDFYYMYGVNRDGMYGWYVYDATEGTIEENILNMHYNLNGTVEEDESNSGFSFGSMSIILIVGIIVVLLLLVILVIIFGVRYRQLAREMEMREAAGGSLTPPDQENPDTLTNETQDNNFSAESGRDDYAMPTEDLQNAQSEQPVPEQTMQESTPPTTEQPKPEQPKPEQPKPEQPKPEQPKSEQPKSEQPEPKPAPKPAKPKSKPEPAKDSDDDDLEFL